MVGGAYHFDHLIRCRSAHLGGRDDAVAAHRHHDHPTGGQERHEVRSHLFGIRRGHRDTAIPMCCNASAKAIEVDEAGTPAATATWSTCSRAPSTPKTKLPDVHAHIIDSGCAVLSRAT